MIPEFPSNSQRPGPPNLKAAPQQEEPKLESVVTGQVVRRKKPLGRRLKETFFSGDSSSVVGYILHEVLIPEIKKIVVDSITQGAEKAVWGEVRSPSRSRLGPYNRPPVTNYNQPRTIVGNGPAMPARRPVTQPSSARIDDVILETDFDARMVAERLIETLEEYGCVAVARLNELLRQSSLTTDHKYGWYDLSTMHIRRVREGFLLVLPDPVPLKD